MARLSGLAVFVLISAAHAQNSSVEAGGKLACAADVAGGAKRVLSAVFDLSSAADFCRKQGEAQICTFMLSTTVESVGDASKSMSKALADCGANRKQTKCAEDLGSIVSSLGQTVAEASLSMMNACLHSDRLHCALGALMPALQAFQIAENMEAALQDCGHSREPPKPSKLSCVANVALAAHDLVRVADTTVQAINHCKKDATDSSLCGSFVSIAVGDVGMAIVKLSLAVQNCHGKDTACTQALGSVVRDLGEIGESVMSLKNGCSGTSCAVQAVWAGATVVELAHGIETSVQACQKKKDSTTTTGTTSTGTSTTTTTTAASHQCNKVQPQSGQKMEWKEDCKKHCKANGVDYMCTWCVYNMPACEAVYGAECLKGYHTCLTGSPRTTATATANLSAPLAEESIVV